MENQEKFEKEEKLDMAAIRLSKIHIDFIKRNPRIAQEAGRAFLALQELEEIVSKMRALLSKDKAFVDILEDGTEEELKDFLTEMLSKNNSDFLKVKDLSRDEITHVQDQLKSKLGVSTLVTEFSE